MMLSNWSIRSSLSFLPPRPYSNSSSSLSLYGSNRLDLRTCVSNAPLILHLLNCRPMSPRYLMLVPVMLASFRFPPL